MPTTIVNSIGTNGRQFATPQEWIDSLPTDLVAANTRYIGEMYNDSEFSGKLVFPLRTASAECSITLRCAAGHSIHDRSDRHTLPLMYDQTKGVGIRTTGGAYEEIALVISSPYTTVEGIQIDHRRNQTKGLFVSTTAVGSKVSKCFIRARPGHVSWNLASIYAGRIEHCLFVYDAGYNPNAAVTIGGVVDLFNVGLLKPSSFGAGGTGFLTNSSGRGKLKNSYVFGFTNAANGTYPEATNNATDAASMPGAAADMVGLVYADQFVQPSTAIANTDWRLKSTSKLLDKGIDLSAAMGQSTDIYGYAYNRGWDIGPAENMESADSTRFIKPVPFLGYKGQPSTKIYVDMDGYYTGDVIITPSAGDKGGVFTPKSVTVNPTNPQASFTYTPVVVGDIEITLNNNRAFKSAKTIYTSALEATTLVLSGVPTSGRAGREVTGIKVGSDGVLDVAVRITPTDGGDGVFTPTFATLSRDVPEVTFAYNSPTGGNKSISIDNDVGYANPDPMVISLLNPIVAVPTLSDDTKIVVTVGTGKDYSDVGAFTAWVRTLNMPELKKTVIGEVYNDHTLGSYTGFYPLVPSDEYLAILRPVPGFSAADYDPINALDYNAEGILLNCSAYGIRFGRGTLVENFRILIAANTVTLANNISGSARGGRVQNNRILLTNNVPGFGSGEYNGHGVLSDNLIIRESGVGPALKSSSTTTAIRNTFVVRGTGSFGTAAIEASSSNVHGNSSIEDNAFINVGPVPVLNAEVFPAGKINNNFTNQALTTPVAGITQVLDKPLVINVTNDYRPAVGGALAGKGTANAVGTIDIRGYDRGGIPDVGCVQGEITVALPVVTITSIVVNGQDVTVSGTSRFNPTSGVAYLDAAEPSYGATSIGPTPVTLTSNAFTVTWRTVEAGSYKVPRIFLTNAGGANRLQYGGEVIEILDVIAELIEGEVPAPTGGAPVINFDKILFDNNALSVTGLFDMQGDDKYTFNVVVQPTDGSAVVNPKVSVNVISSKYGVRFDDLTGNFKVVATATANGKTTVLESPVRKVLTYKADILLPTHP